METVVTSTEMQACDRFAVEKLKIPSIILMENAGRGVVEMMQKHYGSLAGKSTLLFCGKGNNGGDGFVAARHLHNFGANVNVVLVGKSADLKGDAKTNFQILKNIMMNASKAEMLKIIEVQSAKKIIMLPKSDFIVDALFGTGFIGEVRGVFKDVIKWINDSQSVKISIDIPSGVNADDGTAANIGVIAHLTATMALRKIGLILNTGRSYTGITEVIDIGVPKTILNNDKHSTFVIHYKDVRVALPHRPLSAHKHSVGKILVIAGSKGFTGAASMTSTSAMKAGMGAVILGTPASVYPILARKLTEVMVEPLPETIDATLSLSAFGAIEKHLAWADVVVIGPGLSQNSETQQLIQKIVTECDKPMLIDADGLNALPEKISVLKKHKSNEIIITPHTGELSRLIGVSSAEIERNRITIARNVAKEFKLTLVLKGAPTVTAAEDGKVYINSTGNPGMATAGAGDVLAGLIGGLWAQGMNRTEAAFAGVFIHGYAGDLAKKQYGERSILATDIQQFLPKALFNIEQAEFIGSND